MTDGPLRRSERRTLVALRRGPLYRGAVATVLGGKVAAPAVALRTLERRGLVRRTKTAWELTDAGRDAIPARPTTAEAAGQ